MARRLTKEHYDAIAEERGGKCLRAGRTSKDKSLWRCNRGHEWESRNSDVKNKGYWCPHCSGKAPVSPERYHSIAKERGGECLRIGKTTKHKSLWRCSKGHEWQATYKDVANKNSWCMRCFRRRLAQSQMLDKSNYHSAAEARGGKCLRVGRTTNDKSLWRCSKGHEWQATGHSIIHGERWCPHCSGKAPVSPERYHSIAKERGGECLRIGKTTKHKSLWRCADGHEWEAAGSSIINAGYWCPHCSGKAPVSPERYHSIAKERGGECLRIGKTTKHKSLWRCADGHEWEAIYDSICRSKSWCPRCASSNGEIAISDTLAACGIPQKPQASYGACRNPKTGAMLRFDFEATVNGRIILIEFNGIQHYQTIQNSFFGGKKALIKRRYRDSIKKQFCKDNNIPLIVINYNVKDVSDYLLRMLSKVTELSYGELLDYGRNHQPKINYKFQSGKSFQLSLFGDLKI